MTDKFHLVTEPTTADSSDPVYEKDRYTIDQLYTEGKKFEEAFRKRLAEESDLTPDDQRAG